MVTLFYILAVAGGLSGIALGWKTSHFLNPNRNKFARPSFDIFMKRLGLAVGAGAVPFFVFAALANTAAKQQEIENAKKVQATVNQSTQKVWDIYSQGLGEGVSQDSINANRNMNTTIQNTNSH